MQTTNNTLNYIWLTKDRGEVKMIDMDDKHIQFAHKRACIKEVEYHNKASKYSELRDQLEEVASSKGIILDDPDTYVTGNYFKNCRTLKKAIKDKNIGNILMMPDIEVLGKVGESPT